MLSKNKIKYIKSLNTKKYRKIHSQFVVEGEKIVKECFDNSDLVDSIYATKKWFDDNVLNSTFNPSIHHIVESKELKKVTNLSTSSEALAILNMESFLEPKLDQTKQKHLYLESIRDPGNFGTIIRTAEWFGFEQLLCSPDCVELFNQKTLQASMGSFLRVKVIPMALESLADQLENASFYATTMQGTKIQDISLKSPAVIMIGNEGQGLSREAENMAHERISISKIGKTEIDSLNAAISASIILYEISKL